MKALITGAAGFLGHQLTMRLRERGFDVTAAIGPRQDERESRRLRELKQLEVPIISCDLRQEEPLAIVPAEWDVLFHLAAFVRTEEDNDDVRVNDEGTRRLLAQLPLRNKRVVFTSTLAVADNATGGEITPRTLCQPRTAYGRTKLAAEQILREACEAKGAEFTIIRMPTIYGRGYRPHGMFDVLAERLERDDPLARIMWPGRMALLSVQDAAELLCRVATVPETRGRVFLASSDENPTTWQIAEAIAAAKGIPYRPIGLPGPCAALLRATLGSWWQSPVLPHTVQINAWRARLLLNGLYCSGTELAQLVGLSFRDWREGFRQMYADTPVTNGRSGFDAAPTATNP
jgi:nucleoside-diphosphate-sugar epimerase